MIEKPKSGTYPDYFDKYIQLAEGNVIKLLNQQRKELKQLLWTAKSLDRTYAQGKWTIRQVVQHLIDTERVFNYRAMCIGRGEKNPLPSFDHNTYAEHHASHLDRKQLWREYNAVRKSSITLFKNMNDAIMDREGNVGGNVQSARAIPFMIAGHQVHHVEILKDRYGYNG